MISTRFDIREFSEYAKTQYDSSLIHLANQEATEAERLLYRKRGGAVGVDEEKIFNYAQTLKDLISFFRYGIKPKAIDEISGQVFDELFQEIPEDRWFQPRCSDQIDQFTTTKIKAPDRLMDDPRP